MAGTHLPVLKQRSFGETSRRDTWWLQPLLVFLGLGAFLVYANWAALQGAHYTFGPYLSPFYSPELFGDSPHSWFGPKPAAWPAIRPNDTGITQFVYGHMKDYLRRVYGRVVIGRAFRKGKATPNFFARTPSTSR